MTAALALSLALTLALELPVAWAWGLRSRRELTLAALVNVLTNPPVVLAYWFIASRTLWPRLAVQLPLEVLATAVEALCYRGCGEGISRPVGLAVCANALSYGAGLALNTLL